MDARRLSWAGIELRVGEARLLIDPLVWVDPLQDFLGRPRFALVPVEPDPDTWVLVTHLHPDHADRAFLRRVTPGRVLCHHPAAESLGAEGVVTSPLALWQTAQLGPFLVTPVPAHDWRGDDQVSWIVESGGRRIIHCGDTIWHGRWHEIATRYGPFDAAFLPINGVIARLPGRIPHEIPATLPPEAAIEAAVVLEARLACAIHHTLFDNPPGYVEQPCAISRFLTAASRRGVRAVATPEGEKISWPD